MKKKLEKLNSKKFVLSNNELDKIRGGYAAGDKSYDFSYDVHYTNVGSYGQLLDYTAYDICRDF